ncbi:ABC transporter substrate-binding protein [Streptomyces sp. NPDC005318]|uniref:ABC transporter substrate-binding protein n=1 Tax=Streptomyces sp. NPDC005318 TaxID=3157031 RepID=UPI0033A31134
MAISRCKTAALALGAILSACALTGCGSDSAKDASNVTVIQSVPDSVTEVGVQAGEYLDTYSKCAPDLTLKRSVGTSVEKAVAAGSADIGISSSSSVVAAIAGGLQAKIIGSSMDNWNQALLMAPDSAAKKLEDLKPPMKFGITRFGSSGHYATLKLVEKLGWSKDDYEFVTVGELSALQAGIKSGLFNGFVWGPDTGDALEAAGSAKMLDGLVDLIGPNVQTLYFASDEMLKERPEAVRAFMKCSYEAVKELKADRATSLKFFVEDAKKERSVSEGLFDRDMKYVSSDGEISPGALEGVLDAVRSTVPNQKSLTIDDLNEMYSYWGDL